MCRLVLPSKLRLARYTMNGKSLSVRCASLQGSLGHLSGGNPSTRHPDIRVRPTMMVRVRAWHRPRAPPASARCTSARLDCPIWPKCYYPYVVAIAICVLRHRLSFVSDVCLRSLALFVLPILPYLASVLLCSAVVYSPARLATKRGPAPALHDSLARTRSPTRHSSASSSRPSATTTWPSARAGPW